MAGARSSGDQPDAGPAWAWSVLNPRKMTFSLIMIPGGSVM